MPEPDGPSTATTTRRRARGSSRALRRRRATVAAAGDRPGGRRHGPRVARGAAWIASETSRARGDPDPREQPRAPTPLGACRSRAADARRTSSSALAFAAEPRDRCARRPRAAPGGSAVERPRPGGLAGRLAWSPTSTSTVERARRRRARASASPPTGSSARRAPTAPAEPATGRTWVVDPIDGTLNYARRLGPWSVVLSAWRGCGWSRSRCGPAASSTPPPRRAAPSGDAERLAAGRAGRARWHRARRRGPAAGGAGGGLAARVVESSASEIVSVADGRVMGTVRLRR